MSTFKWDWTSLIIVTLLTLILFSEIQTFVSPVMGEVQISGFQYTSDNSPVARYLWLWIKWVCYGLGGVFAAVGLILFLMGWYFNNAGQTKQGWKAAIAGFGFVLVIPFIRIVFGNWLTFAEETPFVPEPTSLLILESWMNGLV